MEPYPNWLRLVIALVIAVASVCIVAVLAWVSIRVTQSARDRDRSRIEACRTLEDRADRAICLSVTP